MYFSLPENEKNNLAYRLDLLNNFGTFSLRFLFPKDMEVKQLPPVSDIKITQTTTSLGWWKNEITLVVTKWNNSWKNKIGIISIPKYIRGFFWYSPSLSHYKIFFVFFSYPTKISLSPLFPEIFRNSLEKYFKIIVCVK